MATSPEPNNHWKYPGPSSRYHKSEVTRPTHHARFKSEYKVQAPVLSTELRAHHRRALSSTTVPPSSPTAWRAGRPVSSSSSSILSHSPNPTSRTMSSLSNITPEKPRRRRSSDLLRDSPFSDSCYFTEDDRSMAASGHAAIPSATQSLIIRLSKLQAQLLREDPPHLFDIVAKKLNEIEAEVAAGPQNSSSMKDSGLFMQEAVEFTETVTPKAPVSIVLPETPLMSPVIEAQEAQSPSPAESDASLREAQHVLESVTKVQTELRQQLEELRALRAEMDLTEDDDLILKAAAQLSIEDDEDLSEKIVGDTEEEGVVPSFEEVSVTTTTTTTTTAATTTAATTTATTTKLDDEQDVHIKSAWRELWDGLTAFAGMDNDLDSDIDI